MAGARRVNDNFQDGFISYSGIIIKWEKNNLLKVTFNKEIWYSCSISLFTYGLRPTVQDIAEAKFRQKIVTRQPVGCRIVPDKMAASHIAAFTFLVITLFARGFGVSDEDFQVGFNDL